MTLATSSSSPSSSSSPLVQLKPPSEIFNSEAPYSIRAISLDKLLEKIETQQSGYQELLPLLLLSHHSYLPNGPIQLLQRWIDSFKHCSNRRSQLHQRQWISHILLVWLNEYSSDWYREEALAELGLQFVNEQLALKNNNKLVRTTTTTTTQTEQLDNNTNNTITSNNSTTSVQSKSYDEYYISKFVSDMLSRLEEAYRDSNEKRESSNENDEDTNSSSANAGDEASSCEELEIDTIPLNKMEEIKARLLQIQRYHTQQKQLGVESNQDEPSETYSPVYPLAMDWSDLSKDDENNESSEEDCTDDDDEEEDDEEEETGFSTSVTKFQFVQQLNSDDTDNAHTDKKNLLQDWSTRELAIQLTLLDMSVFCAIENSECVSRDYHSSASSTSTSSQDSKKDLHLYSPNITKMIDRFDCVNRWAVSQILDQDNMEKRAQVISQLIQLMRELYTLDNYHSLMAIFSSMSSQAIYRLKHTRSKLPTRDLLFLQEMDTLLNPSKRFHALVQEWKYCEPPCIPYLGVFLSQLSAVQTCYDNLIKVGGPVPVKLIHMNKFRLYSKILAEFHTFQKYAKTYRTMFTNAPILQSTITQQIYENDQFSSDSIQEKFLERSRHIEPR